MCRSNYPVVILCFVQLLACGDSTVSPARNGDALIQAGKVQQAIGQYEKALQAERDPRVLRQIGVAHQTLWQWEPSLDYLSEAVEGAPKDAVARLALAMALSAARQPDEARKHARWLISERPASGHGQLLLALLASDAGQANEARQELKRLLEQTPTARAAEVVLAQADLAKRLHDDAQAQAHAKQARGLTPADPVGATQLAYLYGRLGRFAPAELLLKAVVAAEPGRLMAQRQLALVAVELEHSDTALAALMTLPEAQRAEPELQLAHGRALLGKEQARAALPLLSAAAEGLSAEQAKTPKGIQIRTLRAQATAGAGDLPAARAQLEAIVSGGAASGETGMTLVHVKLRMGDEDSALADLEKLSARPESRVVALEILGKLHKDRGRVPQALATFARLVDAAPQSAQAAHFYAGALRASGDDAGAMEQLHRALKLDPRRGSALTSLLRIHIKAGRHAKAQTLLDEYLAAQPDSVELLTSAGRFHFSAGRSAQAREALGKALELDPRAVAPRLLMAKLEREAGKPLRAAAHYEQVLQATARHPTALLGAGETRYEAGDYGAAQKHFEALLVLTPQSSTALNNLAYVYARTPERLDEALKLARKSRAISPSSPQTADTLGWVLHRLGQNDEALPLLRDAIKSLPKQAVVHYHLGMALLAAGEAEAARGALGRALELDGHFEGADDARQALR